ncbi:MAG: hypothetical protein OXG78_04720 [Chloroflexi bacterium]|nr:hypothetical protein [Chloroflexota bacterium]
MRSKIIDTNVPLTAAGLNSDASKQCQLSCVAVLKAVLAGQVKVVIDAKRDVLREYNRRIHPDFRGSLAEQFMLYMLQYHTVAGRVHCLELQQNESGQFVDYPDNSDTWSTRVRRCERFDPDDKKWVALAVRFKKEAGIDAPIVNAADRCWLAFESQLEAAGVKLEVLCREER